MRAILDLGSNSTGEAQYQKIHFLDPINPPHRVLWRKQEEEGILGMFATLGYLYK